MSPGSTPVNSLAPAARIRSIDILRGAIMVLMAIDHVRVYAGLPAGGPEPGIFFTRWITHYCAPGFVFFAGTSAWLYYTKNGSKKRLAGFLITRGLLLVVLELTLIRFGWTFNWNYSGFILTGVIWMIGCCMVIMAALIWLQPLPAGIIGSILIITQSLFAEVPALVPVPSRETFHLFWEFIYPSGGQGPENVAILYVLVPWIGVMAAGYAFGTVLLKEKSLRNKICRWMGLSAILVFIIAGSIAAGKVQEEDTRPFIYRLLAQNKYPPSILYLLMTLGPLIALVPLAEKIRGWLSGVLTIFGRVPFYYYLLHIPLIHLTALAVNFIRTGKTGSGWYNYAPFTNVPPEQQWTLPLLYLVFIIAIIILYFLCRWYAGYKATHPQNKWLKYL